MVGSNPAAPTKLKWVYCRDGGTTSVCKTGTMIHSGFESLYTHTILGSANVGELGRSVKPLLRLSGFESHLPNKTPAEVLDRRRTVKCGLATIKVSACTGVIIRE